MMKDQAKSNFAKYCIYTTLLLIGLMFCSGTILQEFFLRIGLPEERIYLYNSITQGVQVAVMVAMIFFAGRIRRVKRVLLIPCFCMMVLSIVFLLGAVFPVSDVRLYTLVVFSVSALAYLGYGLYVVLSYCLPYSIIDIKDYGKMCGVGSSISGVCTLLLSILYVFALSRWDYFQFASAFFVLSCACFLFSAVLLISMRELPEAKSAPKYDLLGVFKNRDTYVLIAPNLARGIATGILSVTAVIAVSADVLETSGIAYVNSALQISMLVGNLLFTFLCERLGSRRLLVIGTLGMVALWPFLLLFGGSAFAVLFFAMNVFRFIVDVAIPVLVTQIIPQSQVGAYTSVRMLIFTAGQAVATAILPFLLKTFGPIGTMVFAAVMQLICGGAYWWVAKRNRERL